MADNPKFLVDVALPQNVFDSLRDKYDHVASSRDLMSQGQKADDLQILLEAAKRNYHLITKDGGFIDKVDSHPCDPDKYARRTVLKLPDYEIRRAVKFLAAAWRQVTWAKLRIYDAIEIHRTCVVVYMCAGYHYEEIARFSIRVRGN